MMVMLIRKGRDPLWNVGNKGTLRNNGGLNSIWNLKAHQKGIHKWTTSIIQAFWFNRTDFFKKKKKKCL